MVNPKTFIQKVKSFISSDPKRAKFIGLLILAAALPLVIVAALTVQNLQQKASQADVVQITDANGNVLTSTTDPNVFIKINLPSGWELPNQQSSNNLVNNAYAQEEESTSVCDNYTTKTNCLKKEGVCGWGVIGGTGFCATVSSSNPETCRSSYDEWYIYSGASSPNLCKGPTSRPIPSPTTASLQKAAEIPSPTITPDCKVGVKSFQFKTACGTGTKGMARFMHYVCHDGFEGDVGSQITCWDRETWKAYAEQYCSGRSSCLPITPSPGETGEENTQKAPETPSANILQTISLENADSGDGGSVPESIPVYGKENIANIRWKLNDLLPGQTQAQRIVQVTLKGSKETEVFAISIQLERELPVQQAEVTVTETPVVTETAIPLTNTPTPIQDICRVAFDWTARTKNPSYYFGVPPYQIKLLDDQFLTVTEDIIAEKTIIFSGKIEPEKNYQLTICDKQKVCFTLTETSTCSINPLPSNPLSLVFLDLNNDGWVNQEDFQEIASQFGDKGENLKGDLDKDGVVNGNDYNMFIKLTK